MIYVFVDMLTNQPTRCLISEVSEYNIESLVHSVGSSFLYYSMFPPRMDGWMDRWMDGCVSHPSSCMLVNHGPSQQNCIEEYEPWELGAMARYYAFVTTEEVCAKIQQATDRTKTS